MAVAQTILLSAMKGLDLPSVLDGLGFEFCGSSHTVRKLPHERLLHADTGAVLTWPMSDLRPRPRNHLPTIVSK